MIKPSFYDLFECKADKCTDTCCAGWEIEIDNVSMSKYENIKTDFGKRIKHSIEYVDSQPCFCRDKNDRCFFLDKNGLCDIYSRLGQSFLCDICREHPRFYDEFDGIVEAGLGLCCEKVCELLIENDFDILYYIKEQPEEDIFLLLSCRQHIFDILNNNEKPFDIRISECLEYSEKIQIELFDIASKEFVSDKISLFEFVLEAYMKTEGINDRWTSLLEKLKNNLQKILEISVELAFDASLYSKVMSYIIYRHFMQVRFNGEISSVVRMAVMAVVFMYICECYIYNEKGCVSVTDKTDIIKFWSQQIEYSSENTSYCLTIVQ